MRCKRIIIVIGLVVWIIGVFVGRWGLVTSSGDDYVAEQRNDADGGSIDKGGWMAFGLAVQEMNYEGAQGSCRERWNGDYGPRTKDKGLYSYVWNLRIQRCEEIGKIVSTKRLISYYVFGLCKMLD